MNLSPNEAEEALAAIQTISQRTRRSIASGGTSINLIVTGIVWLVGFMCTQFLSGDIVGYIWIGLSFIGSIVGIFLGIRMGKRVRSPQTVPTAKRIGLFWLFLVLFCLGIMAVLWPVDGKKAVVFIVMFIMIGQMAMGLLFSFSSVWWVLPVAVLVLVGYFLLPGYFYLWMSILGGGTMIALGTYIRLRW